MNLREENWPYKHVIARVLLDKAGSFRVQIIEESSSLQTRCRTIVNKAKNIGEHDNKYRTFGMDLLAGDEDYVTTVSHNGVNYTFDFSKVWTLEFISKYVMFRYTGTRDWALSIDV